LIYLPLGLLATFFRLLKEPCNPPYLGYFLCSYATQNANNAILINTLKYLNAFFFSSVYLFVMSSATLGLFLELILGVTSIKEMVNVLVGSSLLQSHIKGGGTFSNRYKMYRNLQILTRMFNTCYQSSTFMSALVGGFSIIVLNGFMLIRMSSNHSSVFLLHIIIGSSATYAGVAHLLRISSQVFIYSKSVFAVDLTRNALQRKRINSIQPMVIKMGSSNYVDRLTCIVFGSNVIETIVSYALVSK